MAPVILNSDILQIRKAMQKKRNNSAWPFIITLYPGISGTDKNPSGKCTDVYGLVRSTVSPSIFVPTAVFLSTVYQSYVAVWSPISSYR